ncbi:MAG: gamma-glutamyl-gamma-aminobutyrate hydrolase family protein [candidate division WOR-3 bacterium]|nr:MAG: gamma-glutamyl-gamma-aminobutyrate hydrolase family protein [candidate division WOR-3 bacterium]
MRTLIIDNYLPNAPQMEHLYNVIKDITVHTVEIKEYSTIHPGEEFKLHDVIILSGSQRLLAESGITESYVHEAEFVKSTQKPVLGICFGHQLLAMAFGSEVIDMGSKVEGYYMIQRLNDNEIFEGLPEKFLVRESHQEMVVEVPFDFELLASSPNCPVEIIKHSMLPIYGVQCHPERFDEEHPVGRTILENFFKLATWYIK